MLSQELSAPLEEACKETSAQAHTDTHIHRHTNIPVHAQAHTLQKPSKEAEYTIGERKTEERVKREKKK